MSKELSTPPAHPIRWQHRKVTTSDKYPFGGAYEFRSEEIFAKTWFDALRQAAALYGTTTENVEVRPL